MNFSRCHPSAPNLQNHEPNQTFVHNSLHLWYYVTAERKWTCILSQCLVPKVEIKSSNCKIPCNLTLKHQDNVLIIFLHPLPYKLSHHTLEKCLKNKNNKITIMWTTISTRHETFWFVVIVFSFLYFLNTQWICILSYEKKNLLLYNDKKKISFLFLSGRNRS